MSEETNIRLLTHRDDLISDETLALYDYWNKIKGEATAPTRSQFDLLAIPQLIPAMIINNLSDQSDEFVVRFHGPTQSEMVGEDLTGQVRAKDNSDEFIARAAEIARLVIESKKPVINGPTLSTARNKEHIVIQSISVPFVENDEVVQIATLVSRLPQT